MLLADASFFLAITNPADRFHAQAVRALGAIDEGLVTTWPVLAELSHLLAARLGVYRWKNRKPFRNLLLEA